MWKAFFIVVCIAIQALSGMSEAAVYCNPEVSKPCGQGCITLAKTCRKSWTTSRVGVNLNANKKKGYANPKFVDQVPK